MTLKEQIRPHAQYWDCYNDEPIKYNHTGKLVKIADDFAIGFAGWFVCHYTEEAFYDKKYIKQMLEIYKKEKGL